MRAILIICTIFFISLTGCGGGSSPPVIPDPPDPWTPDYQPDRKMAEHNLFVTMRDGVAIHVMITRPADASPANMYPALLLVPGGNKDGYSYRNVNFQTNMWELMRNGIVVMTFDPRGRALSEGEENYFGNIHQGDLRELIEWFASRKDILPGGVCVVSTSMAIAVASGTLSKNPELPVRFLLDIEGSHDRFTMTRWDDPRMLEVLGGNGTWDDEFWAEREAIWFIGDVVFPYFRMQTWKDHIHGVYFDHAIEMINAAVDGASPYVQLNEMPPNTIFDISSALTYDWYPVDSIDVSAYWSILRVLELTVE